MNNPFKKVADHIQNTIEEGLFCGAALAIGDRDQIYLKETWGKTSFTPEGTPVNERTLYDMASVTKIMSSTMIALRFITQGKLDLADNLARYFGEENVPDEKKDISVFHLMTHTSGFAASIPLEKYCQSPDETVPFLLSVPLSYKTGSRVVYSCMGYIMLAKILEKIGDRPLDELAREEVFEPLGMSHTGYHPLGLGIDYSQNTAYTERNHHSFGQIRGRVAPGEWLVGEVHDENAYFQNGISGNAGVFSDLNDSIRYAGMLAGFGTLEGQVYLPRCIFETAIRNYTPGMGGKSRPWILSGKRI